MSATLTRTRPMPSRFLERAFVALALLAALVVFKLRVVDPIRAAVTHAAEALP